MHLQDVFIEGPNRERQDIISANSGHALFERRERVPARSCCMTVTRYDGTPGQADFRIVQFCRARHPHCAFS